MGFIFAALFAGYSPKITPMAKQKIAAERKLQPGIRRNGRGKTQDAPREENPDDAPEHAEHDGFDEELHKDRAAVGADGLSDADFARALRDGDEHDVHNADAADKE